ncbi:hypothetical protein NRS6094_04336 [Bacillus subtilis]|uniref:hypothetical protein n=1 Tax=Bacillus subtilis TaxID=1423 RepID=UPI001B955B75|nr:hypothetical protein [Bacillus subtilis]CAF1778126.1 hypothetical protein NRS6094_04336 [Bacillus subtilis]
MCILEEIGFTPEQYMDLHSMGMRDFEIAKNELDVSLETLLLWKVKHSVGKKTKRPIHYFTVDEYKERREKGMHEREIAREFGFSNEYDYYAYKDSIGIPKQKQVIERTPELIAQIEKYHKQGLKQKEIAEKLDVKMCAATVGNIMREFGIKEKQAYRIERTPELIEKIKSYLDLGMTTRQIAKNLKFSQGLVSIIIREEGLR